MQSDEFIAQHGGPVVKGKTGQISVYGQESNPTTWRLAAMNMAIRGIDFNFGGGPGDTLLNDLHPDLRADFVMANPPFNMKEWWSAKLENEPRWLVGTPPAGNALIAGGVADVFALAGLDKPNIGLLSEEFLQDVRQMESRNLAVELLEKLLKDEIKARARTNVVQEKKFGERLLETLRKYHNRAIETAQVIEELIQMAKDFQAELDRVAALGLNPDEIAFYDALANNESAVRELGDEVLKKIAVEITEKLRESTTVDWQVRDSVRAKLRILVRRCLQKWKYPPDQQPNAVELVLSQAEKLAEGWSG